MTAAADWTGKVGATWAEEWERTDRSFAFLAPRLDAAIAEAAPPGRIRAVDLGCGAGTTAMAFAGTRPDAEVLGIDLSPDLIAIATRRARDVENLSFAVGDIGRGGAETGAFDLAMSRHGVMFFDDLPAGFTAIRSMLVPGGRLVFSCFRAAQENDWAVATATAVGASPPGSGAGPGPFALGERERIQAVLDQAGYGAVGVVPVDYRYVAGGGHAPIEDALSFFARIGPAASALRQLDTAARADATKRLRSVLHSHLDLGEVCFTAAAWIVTATA